MSAARRKNLRLRQSFDLGYGGTGAPTAAPWSSPSMFGFSGGGGRAGTIRYLVIESMLTAERRWKVLCRREMSTSGMAARAELEERAAAAFSTSRRRRQSNSLSASIPSWPPTGSVDKYLAALRRHALWSTFPLRGSQYLRENVSSCSPVRGLSVIGEKVDGTAYAEVEDTNSNRPLTAALQQ